MLIDPTQATLLVIDVQEKLIGAVSDPAGTLARTRWLLAATAQLGLPTVISEQYPKGLGPTVAALKAAAPASEVVEKLHFSCVAANCLPESLLARGQVIVCGMETHVCVLQTVLGAARMLTESGETPAELRRRVTSPNGTTQAAIETFQAGGFEALVARAVHAATARGGELSAAND